MYDNTYMIRHALAVKALCTLLLWPSTALARPSADSYVSLSSDLGLGALGGAAYATVQAGIDVRERGLALGIFGRVRLRMQEVDGEGAVRRRDFDEASDFVHLLRSISYRRSFESVRLEAQEGELLGLTLGHGALVRDYSNIADPDHPHSGLRLRLDGSRLAGELALDNFIAPSVIAARLEAVPTARAPGLRVGATAVVDPRAPVAIRRGLAGERAVDGAWNLEVESEPLALLGLDVEHTFRGERGSVTPYSDLASSLLGVGLHLGANGRLRVGRGERFLVGQLEYRASSDGYSPAHVTTFYDLERYQASLSLAAPERLVGADAGLAEPKLAGLKRPGLYGGHGVLAQVGFEAERWLRLRLGFERRPGPDANTLWFRAASAPHPRVDLGCLLYARGLGQAGADATGLAAMVEGRFRITPYLYALGQYSRLWSLEAGTRYFGVLQSLNLSLGATWSG